MYAPAPMQPAIGIVSTQAQTILTVIPQRTALSRFIAPNPTMEPAMVWVVLTGMPIASVAKSVMAAPDSAQKPPKGSSLVILQLPAQSANTGLWGQRRQDCRDVAGSVAYLEECGPQRHSSLAPLPDGTKGQGGQKRTRHATKQMSSPVRAPTQARGCVYRRKAKEALRRLSSSPPTEQANGSDSEEDKGGRLGNRNR